MKKVLELIGVVLGSALFGLIVALILSGISASGVVGMEITHTFFWIAFILAVIIAPAAAWFVGKSWKISVICLLSTAAVVGGGLWYLDSWLGLKKVEQDAANQPPPPLPHTSAPTPIIPIVKTPQGTQTHSALSSPPKMSQQCAPGSACAMSSGQQGGVTAGVYVGPPPIHLTLAKIIDNVIDKDEDGNTVPSRFKYNKDVIVAVDGTYTPVSIAVVCDAPLSEVSSYISQGEGGGMMKVNWLDTVSDDRKAAIVYFEGTPATPDHPITVRIRSNAPFSVLRVVKAKLKEHDTQSAPTSNQEQPMSQNCQGGNCAMSNAQTGGITAGQVVITTDPPLPHVTWTASDFPAGGTNPAEYIDFSIDGPLSSPTFAATCDQPCASESGGMSTSGSMFQTQIGSNGPNVAILHFNFPSLITQKMPMHWIIRSRTQAKIKILTIKAVRL